MRISDLNNHNRRQIRKAGPRYTPALNPDSPNLEITALLKCFDALSFAPAYQARIGSLREKLAETWQHTRSTTIRHLFQRRKTTPDLLVNLLSALQEADPRNVSTTHRECRTVLKRMERKLEAYDRLLWEQVKGADERTEEDKSKAREEEYELRKLQLSIRPIHQFFNSHESALLTTNAMLLLGAWGTGKTHSLCDLTQQRMNNDLPTLLALAQELPPRQYPLNALCLASGFPNDANALLSSLQVLGQRRGVRALLIVDAINEGDQREWRRALRRLCIQMRAYPNVGLVLSCRTPFDRLLVRPRTRSLLIVVDHPGFAEIEFDAQLAFFDYYEIPTPGYPLITPEFSRPLFLKLFCEAIRRLGPSQKTRSLREVASGQKGMTYILERFVKAIGHRLENDLQIPRGFCWSVLKGDRPAGVHGVLGVAPIMAAQLRDYVTKEECLNAIGAFLGPRDGPQKRRKILRRMVADGLLGESVRWDDTVEGVGFPYQRFGDHLVARHLLASDLDVRSSAHVRRSFYRNRPLGKVFATFPGGYSYVMPGLASAIMIEFPERTRKVLPHEERELVFYLPRACTPAEAVMNTFLEGLPWRSRESFTRQTDRVIEFFLRDYGQRSAVRTFEVLVDLACRKEHPYSSAGLEQNLALLSIPDRDLSWTEFVRECADSSTIFRLLAWVERNADAPIEAGAAVEALTVVSLFLTTTRRQLRDRVTRALFLLGLQHPAALFTRALRALEFNDPYVPERVLAACYGVAMAHWADPAGTRLRSELPTFAQSLISAMFLPGAPHRTRHVLMRDYALGVIELADRVQPGCVKPGHRRYLRAPFSQIPPPFREAAAIPDEQCVAAEGALHMDFNNYTLGRLISDRKNYDSEHPEYVDVRRQILGRITDLGYSPERFGELDKSIGRHSWYDQREDGGKTDRYGKKYSWIAFFEMYGLRIDTGALAERRMEERTSDGDIDPSFPQTPRPWKPRLRNPFDVNPKNVAEWMRSGPTLSYDALLHPSQVDRARGPWLLLDGYVRREAVNDHRAIFTFLRAVLVKAGDVDRLRAEYGRVEVPSNVIPRVGGDYYTYAGEIPWSRRFGTDLRWKNGKAKRHVEQIYRWYGQGKWDPGVNVELTAHGYAWESYHSALNQSGHLLYPAPAICEMLQLVGHRHCGDLYDPQGRGATLYRRFKEGDDVLALDVLYIRRSLLRRYLIATGQVLVWLIWGERECKRDVILEMYNEPSVRDVLDAQANSYKVMLVATSVKGARPPAYGR